MRHGTQVSLNMRKKKCFKCGETKSLSMFYSHPMMADGRLGKCKECTKTDVQRNYVRRRESYLAYEKARSKRPERRKANAKRNRDWMMDPLHRQASAAFKSAIKRGILVRPDKCSGCSSIGKVDGHHPDYSKPLQVVWLCRTCHRRLHAK